jgi:hypothetical protein
VTRRYHGVEYGLPHIEGRPVSRTTYVHHGCRCDGCREANRIGTYAHHARLAERAANGHPDGVEVSDSTYRNWSCRCEGCREAHAEVMRSTSHLNTLYMSRTRKALRK